MYNAPVFPSSRSSKITKTTTFITRLYMIYSLINNGVCNLPRGVKRGKIKVKVMKLMVGLGSALQVDKFFFLFLFLPDRGRKRGKDGGLGGVRLIGTDPDPDPDPLELLLSLESFFFPEEVVKLIPYQVIGAHTYIYTYIHAYVCMHAYIYIHNIQVTYVHIYA